MRYLIAIIITIFTAAAIFIMGKRDKKIPGKVAACIIGLEIIGCIISISDGSGNAVVKKIKRPGAGESAEEYEMTAKSGEHKEKVTVTVSERELSEEAALKALKKAEKKIKATYLGENENRNRVYRDLNLKSVYDEVVKAEWEITPDGYFDSEGKIENANINEPTDVTVRCLMSCKDNSQLIELQITAVQVPENTENGFNYYLDQAVREADENNRTSKYLTLPASVNGKKIVFSEKREDDGLKLVILMALALALYIFYVRYKQKDNDKRRQKEISLDYPKMVSQLSMYIGAGFSVKAAFAHVGNAYIQGRNRGHPERVAYEQVIRMNRKIRDGEDEERAYNELGNSLADRGFKKLTLLLTQCIKKGSRELRDQLEQEEKEAYYKRRTDAKIAGEEAALKLLMPMMGLLGVIFIVLAVPAFMQMS